MKKILILVFATSLFLIFPFYTYADTNEDYINSFSIANGEELSEIIDGNTKEFFDTNGIDIKDYSWVNKLSYQNVFKYIFSLFKNGLKKPLKAGLTVVAVILLTSAFLSLNENEGTKKAVTVAVILLVSLTVVYDIWSIITASVSAIKYISTFMIGFIPIFLGAVYLCGGTVTATVSGGLLLFSAQAVSFFASDFVLPIMGGYLSLNLVSGISPIESLCELTSAIKKVAVWVLSFVFTVFVGILGIQTSVNSAADSLALKTTKFIAGTCVPIVGTALSDAAATIFSSMSLVKSSFGIYGVVVVAISVIPLIIELIVWKISISVSSSLAGSFGITAVSSFLKATDSLLSVIIAIIIFSGGLFIISLSLMVSAVKL